MTAKPWNEITREDYLRMIDRHWPFWLTLAEFILVNKPRSIVEIGCGLGPMCYLVDEYTGIDLNQTVLTNNELFYRRGKWIQGDWLEMEGLEGELFLASSMIEHAETFQLFLEKALRVPFKYAVMTFHKGLREKEQLERHPTGPFWENYYSRADVEAWLSSRFKFGSVRWVLYDFPFSRRRRQIQRESILVIDRTGVGQLDMFSKRAL